MAKQTNIYFRSFRNIMKLYLYDFYVYFKLSLDEEVKMYWVENMMEKKSKNVLKKEKNMVGREISWTKKYILLARLNFCFLKVNIW